MIEKLLEIDKAVFLWLNSFHSPFWDSFFLVYTNSKSWIPVIVLMIYLLFRNFTAKQAFVYLLIAVAAVGACDYIASGIMKPYFARLRPCHDFLDEMTLVGRCGGQFGFVSSHAANAFGVFTAFSLIFKNNKRIFWGLLIWAIIMAYSRIYIGVHHPGDIIMGAIIGLIVPRVFLYIYTRLKPKGM